MVLVQPEESFYTIMQSIQLDTTPQNAGKEDSNTIPSINEPTKNVLESDRARMIPSSTRTMRETDNTSTKTVSAPSNTAYDLGLLNNERQRTQDLGHENTGSKLRIKDLALGDKPTTSQYH